MNLLRFLPNLRVLVALAFLCANLSFQFPSSSCVDTDDYFFLSDAEDRSFKSAVQSHVPFLTLSFEHYFLTVVQRFLRPGFFSVRNPFCWGSHYDSRAPPVLV